jgi:hypothetical protein
MRLSSGPGLKNDSIEHGRFFGGKAGERLAIIVKHFIGSLRVIGSGRGLPLAQARIESLRDYGAQVQISLARDSFRFRKGGDRQCEFCPALLRPEKRPALHGNTLASKLASKRIQLELRCRMAPASKAVGAGIFPRQLGKDVQRQAGIVPVTTPRLQRGARLRRAKTQKFLGGFWIFASDYIFWDGSGEDVGIEQEPEIHKSLPLLNAS